MAGCPVAHIFHGIFVYGSGIALQGGRGAVYLERAVKPGGAVKPRKGTGASSKTCMKIIRTKEGKRKTLLWLSTFKLNNLKQQKNKQKRNKIDTRNCVVQS